MRVLPEQITTTWIDTLTDVDLIEVEARVHSKFTVLERREKKLRGARFQLMRGSAELIHTWDRWSRLHSATRERSLRPRRDK